MRDGATTRDDVAGGTLSDLYDVAIYEKSTRMIDAIIGTNMRRWDGRGTGRNTAELRQETGEERVNERYAVTIVPAGKYKKGDTLEDQS